MVHVKVNSKKMCWLMASLSVMDEVRGLEQQRGVAHSRVEAHVSQALCNM